MTERRNSSRVLFGRGYSAKIMAIDGTWQRDCRLGDVSETGAKMTIKGSVSGIDTKEFFLVLSTTGNAHRRCERVWVQGDDIGVRFLRDEAGPATRRKRVAADRHPEPHDAD